MSKALTKVVTPKGELAWITITGEGKENMSGKLQYVASVILDPKKEADKAFIDSIDDFWDDNKPAWMGKRKAKSLGYYLCDPLRGDDGEPLRDEEDKVKYDPNGRVMVSFKTGTTFPDGSAKVVKTYNSKAKEVSLGKIRIGNGSIGYISGAMDIYEVTDSKKKGTDAGITFYLNAIQINKLVEFSSDDGFKPSEDDDEEDSFTGDEGFEGVGEPEPAAEVEKPTKKGGPRL